MDDSQLLARAKQVAKRADFEQTVGTGAGALGGGYVGGVSGTALATLLSVLAAQKRLIPENAVAPAVITGGLGGMALGGYAGGRLGHRLFSPKSKRASMLKIALNPTAIVEPAAQALKMPFEAMMEASAIHPNPNHVKALGALGEALFRRSRLGNSPGQSFMSFMMPRYGQIESIQAARDQAARMLRRTPRPAREWAQKDVNKDLRTMYSELGHAASPRMKAIRYGVPAIAGGVGAGTLGYGYGKFTGQNEGAENAAQSIDSAPLLTRLQRAIFPQQSEQTLNPQSNTSPYERILG